MTSLKHIGTKVPQEVYEMWQKHCEKQKQTSYERLQSMIAAELGIDLEYRGWVIKPKNDHELRNISDKRRIK